MMNSRAVWWLAGLAAVAAGPVLAEIYKHVDEQGRVTYSNVPMKGAKKLDLEPLSSVPLARPQSGSGLRPSGGSSSGPEDFPKVDVDTQKKRDLTRKGVLEDELRNEEKAVAEARKALEDGSATLKSGETSRSSAGYLTRVAKLKDAVTVREGNVQALRKELANLK